MPLNQEETAVFGHFFEVMVKRGLLYYLLDQKIARPDAAALERWNKFRLQSLLDALIQTPGLSDPNLQERIINFGRHLALIGYGLGWTVIREWIKQIRKKQAPHLERLWCPLNWPKEGNSESTLKEFWHIMEIPGAIDRDWSKRGQPVNADFLALFALADQSRHLLCLEFSKNIPYFVPDFNDAAAHLDELQSYRRRIDSRSLFARIQSEVNGYNFALSEDIISYINAFTSRDKPFYKLCQGASYVTQFVERLATRQQPLSAVTAYVLAVTPDGIEGMNAPLGIPAAQLDPKTDLMKRLGQLYRTHPKNSDSSPESISQELLRVTTRISNALPRAMRTVLQDKFGPNWMTPEKSDKNIFFDYSEEVSNFQNPAAPVSRATALGWIDDALCGNFFPGSARERIALELRAQENEAKSAPNQDMITLRAIHSAAITAALEATAPGEIRVLALEGYPGIGKTHSVIKAINTLPNGFLFCYFSPRVIINNDVMAKIHGVANTVVLTSNSKLIQGALAYYRREHNRYLHGAVIWTPRPDIRLPEKSSIVYLDSEDATYMDEEYAEAGLRQHRIDERTSVIEQRPTQGVMTTLGQAARDLLECNPNLKRMAITASIQGYREPNLTQTTLDQLIQNFFGRKKASDLKGFAIRENTAQRMPTVVLMADEIAGDGAGAPLVRALYKMLDEHFRQPWQVQGQKSPFRMVLIIADASLGNANVMASYLRDDLAVEKILVSAGRKDQPFSVLSHPLPLGFNGKNVPTLHIMADGFPARRLLLNFRVMLNQVLLHKHNGESLHPRAAIRFYNNNNMLESAARMILTYLQNLPAQQQIIFFAQDKFFLRELENLLLDDQELMRIGLSRPPDLNKETLAKLDSSVLPAERSQLLNDIGRNQKRVILMTSSGTRGVSFPNATVIIAFVPRFSLEAGLMELAQLIYRGRGGKNGDNYDRRLIMAIHEFIPCDSSEPLPPQYLARRRLDVISLLMLLRATILTRICGDAGLAGQSLAIVPIGRIGVDLQVTALSGCIREFWNEGKIYIKEKDALHKGFLTNVIILVEKIFTNHHWDGVYAREKGFSTLSDLETMRSFSNNITHPYSLLIAPECPARLPDYLYGLGPIWLEDWKDVEINEKIIYSLWDPELEKDVATLRKHLKYLIKNQQDFPALLRNKARDVLNILWPDLETQNKQVQAYKPLQSQIWTILSGDYLRFFEDISVTPPQLRPIQENDANTWLETLTEIAKLYRTPSATHPVLPVFQKQPFLAMVINGTPHNLHQVLDSRYFMASTEFNLLNTLLFSSD